MVGGDESIYSLLVSVYVLLKESKRVVFVDVLSSSWFICVLFLIIE